MITRDEYLKALDIVEKYNKQIKIEYYMPNWRDFSPRRKRLGLSMQDVTKCTGVSKATISRLEQGKEVYYGNVKTINDFYLQNEER